MTDDGEPTRPAEGTEKSRHPSLPARSRDVTDEVAGFLIVGGISPGIIAKLKARDADHPEESGDDPDLDVEPTAPQRGGSRLEGQSPAGYLAPSPQIRSSPSTSVPIRAWNQPGDRPNRSR
jgi:hypothetical protein